MQRITADANAARHYDLPGLSVACGLWLPGCVDLTVVDCDGDVTGNEEGVDNGDADGGAFENADALDQDEAFDAEARVRRASERVNQNRLRLQHIAELSRTLGTTSDAVATTETSDPSVRRVLHRELDEASRALLCDTVGDAINYKSKPNQTTAMEDDGSVPLSSSKQCTWRRGCGSVGFSTCSWCRGSGVGT